MERKEKLSQDLQHLLMEIGEKSALFMLYVKVVKDSEWEVYQNLSESGCDLVLLNPQNNDKIKVEVKTRQRLYTTSLKNVSRVQFTVTEKEYESCDFVVAYWWDRNYFFVVPKNDLTPTSSNNERLYRYLVNERVDKSLNDEGAKFLGKWDLIIDRMNIKDK
ncbi:hypothetical protein AXX12_17155 [Anaerosporomusa subterranea]|uniref:PD(D/E)XK endonuclease domain-containing protein n=1 Tax=Anaerosporomusa subterranea TaxID=1794912 RepID=A0A154BUU3_ANASB|nr:hypothetical protein [Anaerosporomusa subterranea]KYZ77793.1 hypothetical protein AXX12_17155 [Anaerosporomusa subterranea]